MVVSTGAIAAIRTDGNPQRAEATAAAPMIVKNLETDYGANPHMPADQIAGILQAAVDDVGQAGGGTVLIPAEEAQWNLDRPIFVGYPNVTIAGQGNGTWINSRGILLGMRRQYPQAITAGHFPEVKPGSGVFDASVTGTKFGLRTTDGKTGASGFFPNSWETYGGEIQHREGDDYWGDYARAVSAPIYWQSPQYTINLIIRNNSPSPLKGTVCGVGPGGQTTRSTTGTIGDPLSVWTIESDPATGANLAFRFRALDAQGASHVESVPISVAPVAQGVLRVCVQLDFTIGACRAWSSLSTDHPVPPALSGRLDLGPGFHFMPLRYGAFRMGAVTDNPFSGSPWKTGTQGDWTFCGFSVFNDLRYSLAAANDAPGAALKKVEDNTTPPTDADLYFPQGRPNVVGYLPLDRKPTDVLLREGDDFVYWLPTRPLQPVPGTLTVRDLSLGGRTDILTVGEAEHVLVRAVYQPGGALRGVGSWDCNPPNNILEVHDCSLTGRDAIIYGKSEDLRISNIDGGGGQADFRLVGCQGEITYVLITAFVAADNYFALYSGPYGGPSGSLTSPSTRKGIAGFRGNRPSTWNLRSARATAAAPSPSTAASTPVPCPPDRP